MNDLKARLRQIGERLKTLTSKLSKKARTLIIGTLVLVVVLLMALFIYRSTRPYTVLFTGLATEDMSSIVSFLESNGVTSYRVDGNDTILVPEGQEASLKARIIQENYYPTSGYGYRTYLDNSGILTSESAQQQLILYDLQDRLGAVIKNMNGVKEAVVNLTPGESGRYILNQDNVVEASANVTVTMQNGQELTSKMAAGIRALLATSLKDLEITNVVILDQDGNLYTGGDSAAASDSSDLKMTLEARVNATVKNKVLEALTPFFGEDNVRVSVYSNVDVSRTYEESIKYSSPEETNWDSLGGHGLIGEYVWDNAIVRNGDETAGGVPGTTTNSDLNEYITQGGGITGNEQQIGTSGSIRHDNDKTTTQKDNAGGVITDVQVSVSINSRTAGEVNPANYIAHVARAAGINAEVQNEKISILAMPFYQEPVIPPIPTPEGLRGWMLYALIAGIALFLVLLILILVLRRRAKKRKEAKRRAEAEAAARKAAEAAAAALEGAKQGAQIMDMHSERSMELRQDVRQFAEENPEIAAQMVKAWLKGGDDHG